MPKAIIFDMDGVIINSEPIHADATKLVMKKYGVNLTNKDLESYIGKPGRFAFEDLIKKHNLNITPTQFADQKREFFLPALTAKGTAVPGVIDLINHLKSGKHLLAIGSSSRRFLIDFVLEKLDLTSYFDVIVSADDVTRGKPDPEIFEKAFLGLQALSPTLTKDDCTVIEDSTAGISASRAAGIKCIAYKNPKSGRQDLSQADLIVDDFATIIP